MPDITSRPYRPNPEMACERCCFGRGPHATFCHAIRKAPFTIFGQEVWIDPGMSRDEVAMFYALDGKVLRVGVRGCTNKAALMPGYVPPKTEAPTLRVSKIDYETKTVTLDIPGGPAVGREVEPGVTAFPVQAFRRL